MQHFFCSGFLQKTGVVSASRSFQCLMVLLFSFSFAHAQYGIGNPDKIKKLEGRTLIVVKEEISGRILKILKTKRRPDQIERYTNSVENYNAAMQEVVEKFWLYDTPVEYKTYSQVKKLYKSKNYAVLFCATVENFKVKGASGGKMHEGLAWSYQDVNVDRDYWDKYTVMQIRLIEELHNPEPIYSQNLANIFPEKADLVFGVQALGYYTQDSDNQHKEQKLKKVMQVTGEVLATKTLLLNQSWMETSLSAMEVKAVYPYAFQIADAHTFNNLVMQADSGYAYLQIVPQISSLKNKIKIQYLHLIIDAADGKVLGLSSPGLSEGNKRITKGNLKDYSQYARK